MSRMKSLQVLSGILVLLMCGCALAGSTSTPVPVASSLPTPISTITLVPNTPAAVVKLAAVKLVIQPPAGDLARVIHLAFSPDGATLISQTDHGSIVLWDAATGQCIDSLTGPGYFAEGLALKPDGEMLASGSCGAHDSGSHGCDRYEVILWDLDTRQPIGQPLELHLAGSTTPALLFGPDGKTLAAMQSGITGSGIIQLFDVDTRQSLISPLGDQEQFSGMAFSPDNKFMALANIVGVIYLWDPNTHHILSHLIGQKGFVKSLVFRPDGKILASAVSGPIDVPHIQLWDVTKGQLIGQPLTVQTPTGTPVGLIDLAFSPDGNLLASLDENGFLTLWDVAAGRQMGPSFTAQSAADGAGMTSSIAFSQEGTLASGNKDGTITLWDIQLP